MATTMSLIAKQTVGSGGVASVTFTNIPQTFTDLKIVLSVRGAGSVSNESFYVYPNSSSANGNRIALYGSGSSAGAETFANIRTDYYSGNSATASVFGSGEVYIPNYRTSNNKSLNMEGVAEGMTGAMYMAVTSALWSNSAAITSLQIVGLNGNITEFSEICLYGISNSSTQNTSVPLAYGGDIIRTDGTYWYHTFINSGTFTPLKNLTCDYLVVAGGGGAGYNIGGGGGGGGYRTSIGGTALSLTAQAYTATVGAGGAGVISGDGTGGSGGNSTFSTITSAGGGGGAGQSAYNGVAGGSGGGGARGQVGATTHPGGAGNTPSTTPAQGYSGGDANYGGGSSNTAAGGGGAGAVGGASGSGFNGAGGVGASNSISGTATYYAGGGGGSSYIGDTGTGGAGGNGGGGAGGNSGGAGSNGTPNTGGGGGGGGQDNSTAYRGGNGGSGIIILRYAV